MKRVVSIRARVIYGRSGRRSRQQAEIGRGYTGAGTSRQVRDQDQDQDQDSEYAGQRHMGKTPRQDGVAEEELNILPGVR